MVLVTTDPLHLSLLQTLAGVHINWSEVTDADCSDASYKSALETLVRAGIIDAKIEIVVSVEGRLGSIKAAYHCYGACDDLLNRDADRHARNCAEWLNQDGGLAGPLIVKKRMLAVRLSAKSIEAKLDRPNDKLALIPAIVSQLASDVRADIHWTAPPRIEMLNISRSAQSGPDPDHEGVFYWRGTGHRFTKRNWQLLRAIWGHDEVNIADVGELVWGDDLTPESTIRAQLNRLNTQMGGLNIPLAWRIDARQIVPEQ